MALDFEWPKTIQFIKLKIKLSKIVLSENRCWEKKKKKKIDVESLQKDIK